MQLISAFKEHFHQLYRSIRFLEGEIKDKTREEVVVMLKRNIEELTSFVNLLISVDETLPLLRCQKALHGFEKDLSELYLVYLEEDLLDLEKAMELEHREFHALLASEKKKKKDKYRELAHDLYLNTIHATDQFVSNHIKVMNPENVKEKIVSYFENTIKVINEQYLSSRFEGLKETVFEISYNFELLRKMGSESNMDEGQKIISELSYLREKLTNRLLYLDAARKISDLEAGSMDVQQLNNRVIDIEDELLGSSASFEKLSNRIIDYLRKVLWEKSGAVGESRHDSVPPINLREIYK